MNANHVNLIIYHIVYCVQNISKIDVSERSPYNQPLFSTNIDQPDSLGTALCMFAQTHYDLLVSAFSDSLWVY